MLGCAIVGPSVYFAYKEETYTVVEGFWLDRNLEDFLKIREIIS